MTQQSICSQVREAEDNYINGSTSLGKYVNWSMYETIERIDAYSNSRHISGSQDSLGRDKPFFNIVASTSNIWYRATDIDRKDIKILPSSSSQTGQAFMATVILQQWMRDARFGVFLNDWGRALAKYGSAVVKFVKKNGELVASVVPWNRFIPDPVDFDAIPRIEKFYKTESQLYRMVDELGYDKERVEALCDAISTRKNIDGQQTDNKSGFIELYEVHGLLSKKVYNDSKGLESVDGDDDTYFRQMHVVSFVANGAVDANGKPEYDDFTLFSGKEEQDPYMITHLIKEDGRTLSIGAIEYLFDAQWMQNHTIKNQKDVLDLSSKLIFQTSDSAYLGRNVLSALESGDIMIHKVNEPLTQINNSKADIVALQNFGTQWQMLAQELTSTPDAIRGNTMPSGTPYSLAAFSGAQANSLFEVMTENKGFAIEDMMRIHVLPFVKTKMDNKDEVMAILDDAGIAEIDSMYIPQEAISRYNKKFKEDLIAGNVPEDFDPVIDEGDVRKEMASLGNKRFFIPSDMDETTWKESLKDLEMSVIVEVTNEQSDKQAVLTTLSTVLQSIAGNPMILQDPNAKLIFNRILGETGIISPLQLSTAQAQPIPPTASPPTVGAGALPEITA